ncbi:putative invertase inhibitor [Juglans regia]|uniref:Invertase inhibitor n=2 Tax=Juglans regia TaxID=51240 RepID=A0A2I4EI34_JUGRE|nr:putative invertase inhibitor [Juglans regia]
MIYIARIILQTKMRLPLFYLSLPIWFFLVFSIFHAINANNLIPETCKKCAQQDPNLIYNFCVTSLQAAPESYSASDIRELGKISINLINLNVTNTTRRVKKLLECKKLDPYVKACLNDCYNLYSNAGTATKQAMKDYKNKHYKDANIEVSSIIDASTTCEDGFKEKKGVVSPLTKINNDTFQLSAIALSIIGMLS